MALPDEVTQLTQLGYLVAVALFILGLHYLNSPATARRGNALASLGMLAAVVVTLLAFDIVNLEWIGVGVITGALLGAAGARLVKMTQMPQMVGLFNGFGGGASAFVAMAEFLRVPGAELDTTVSVLVGVLIGSLTLTGSLVAFAKLHGLIRGAPLTFPLQQPLNFVLFALFAAGGVYLAAVTPSIPLFLGLVVVAMALGFLLIIPIGGADMPVVISLLNSFSGLAASAAGFVLGNEVLIVAGALVGAAGLILTQIMTKAMNRTLGNVLFGAFGVGDSTGVVAEGEKPVRSVDAEEAAMIVGYANSVIVVPGFGLAAAQAQHALADLADLLEERGVDVKYAIHPVAGRMPGHMNVLLAEAKVPYPKLYDMEDVNPEFKKTDVALVVGANDVVNPGARHEEGSPIYGMPILNADEARHVIVIKRSLSPGFSGVDNELFYMDKTMMLFDDAREALMNVLRHVKEL